MFLDKNTNIRQFAIENKLNLASLLNEVSIKDTIKDSTTTNTQPLDLSFLVYDDTEKKTFWGIDASDDKLKLDVIHNRFHNSKHCAYCGAVEDLILNLIDSNPHNFLVSNLEVICRHCFAKRFAKSTTMTVTKEFTFDSCHKLFNYTGMCQYPHGHTYKLLVTLEKPLDLISGMVEDFSILSKSVKNWIISSLDHNDINEVIPGIITTAEIMTIWIWKILAQKALIKGLYKIELYETATSKATITKETMLNLVMNQVPDFFNPKKSKIIL